MTLQKVKAPYQGTKVDPEQSMLEINKLLRKYGINNYTWTTLWDRGIVELRFAIEEEVVTPGPEQYGRPTEVRKKLPAVLIKIRPPSMTEKHKTWDPKKGRNVTIETPNWAISMRLLLHYLKSKLESVTWGLSEVKEEFLAQTIIHDAQGQERTISEIVLPALEESGGVLSLPSRTESRDESKVVDTTVDGVQGESR